jgi:adenylate kinase family enzyme
MRRVAVIGNSGGGKSVLARRLAAKLELPCVEIDALLWLPGWHLSPDYESAHSRQIAQDRWIIEGLGSRTSIPRRLQRATILFSSTWSFGCTSGWRPAGK